MKKLTLKNVIIPIFNLSENSKSVNIDVELKYNQFVFSKDEIIELLNNAFESGQKYEAYWDNGKSTYPGKDEFINNLLNP